MNISNCWALFAWNFPFSNVFVWENVCEAHAAFFSDDDAMNFSFLFLLSGKREHTRFCSHHRIHFICRHLKIFQWKWMRAKQVIIRNKRERETEQTRFLIFPLHSVITTTTRQRKWVIPILMQKKSNKMRILILWAITLRSFNNLKI